MVEGSLNFYFHSLQILFLSGVKEKHGHWLFIKFCFVLVFSRHPIILPM